MEQRADNLATTINNQVLGATAMTPQEQAFHDAMLSAFQGELPGLQSRAGQTGEQLFQGQGGLAQDYARQIQQNLDNPEQISFESTFNPQLQLLQDAVKARAAQRGITGSGLELENLGRAGLDLVIKESQARNQNALINAKIREQGFEDAGNLLNTELGLSKDARSELQSYLDRGLTASDVIRNRQAQGSVQAAAASQPYFKASIDALDNRVQQGQQTTRQIAGGLGGLAVGALTGGLGLIPGIAAGGMGALAGGLGSLGATMGAFPQGGNPIYNQPQSSPYAGALYGGQQQLDPSTYALNSASLGLNRNLF